jgi:hypothetical protein
VRPGERSQPGGQGPGQQHSHAPARSGNADGRRPCSRRSGGRRCSRGRQLLSEAVSSTQSTAVSLSLSS